MKDKEKMADPPKKDCHCVKPTLVIDEDHLEKYPYFKNVCCYCGGKLIRTGGVMWFKRGYLKELRFW